MPRPTRFEIPTVRLTVFVHPATKDAILRQAITARVKPGQVVDGLVRGTSRVGAGGQLANGEEAKGLRPSSPVTFGPGVVVPNPRGGVEIVQYPSAPKRQGRRGHREGVTSSGAIKCLDCNTMKMNRAAWDKPCPGPTKEDA